MGLAVGIVGASFVAYMVKYWGKRWFLYTIVALIATIAGMIFNSVNKKSNMGIQEPKGPPRQKSTDAQGAQETAEASKSASKTKSG